MELLTLESLIAAIIAVVAGLMRGFAGFGSGMLMAPVFAVLFGPIETVATIIIMEILVSIQLVPRALVEIEWRF
ncbi:MAG: sulfite exporter TauE/SafE family protein, partial [Anaerolineae bacterium]